jgi:glyoxylase I family protein
MAEFPPITYVAVTVTDLERSTRWYGELLAAEPVLDEDEQTGGFHHTVFVLGGGQLLGLHTHPQAPGDTFDEHRTGLDHVAFACRDRGELQAWAARLDELGIAHGGIKDATTALVSPSATRTELPSSSSHRLPDPRPPSPCISRKPARGAVSERNRSQLMRPRWLPWWPRKLCPRATKNSTALMSTRSDQPAGSREARAPAPNDALMFVKGSDDVFLISFLGF